MNFRFHKLYDYRARQSTYQNSNKYHKRIIGYKRNTIQKIKNEESKSAQNMQENLSDLIRDEKDSPEKDEIKIYEKTPKRILILIGKIISVVGCFCSILGIVYFVLNICEIGFYYLFLIGSLVSIAGLGVSVYGCYKLWKKNKNPEILVDSRRNFFFDAKIY